MRGDKVSYPTVHLLFRPRRLKIQSLQKYKYRVRHKEPRYTSNRDTTSVNFRFGSGPPLHDHAIEQPSRLDRQVVVIERAIWESRPDRIRTGVIFGARAT
jgi:hypothetical protein